MAGTFDTSDEAAQRGRYLATLLGLGIIERVTPFNEASPKARRSIYRLADPFFAFWYRFVGGRTDLIEAGLGSVAAQRAGSGLLHPRGQAIRGHLPAVAHSPSP